MKFFERVPRTKETRDAETVHRNLVQQSELLTREHTYQARRADEILPLRREEAQLEVHLELAEAKLRSAQLKSRNHPELLALEKELRVLRGEPEPEIVPDVALEAAQAEYDKAKATLDTKRVEIAERDAELRRVCGLE
ncbi:MAG: hypothetical protein KA104_00730 [Candidatus Pacebacteria bacterium]|nr:hypothetical protein [Candidatus Paceibacterota bacterium]